MAVVTISDMGVDGEGIGKVDGYTLFVKDAVIGDVVNVKVMKAKKQYGYARLMEIVEPSPYRTEPVCPVARQCGGCQIQSLSYEKQLEFKKNKVRGNLIRIGGFEEKLIDRIMEPIAGMEEPFHYRNKARILCRTHPSDYFQSRLRTWSSDQSCDSGKSAGIYERKPYQRLR